MRQPEDSMSRTLVGTLALAGALLVSAAIAAPAWADDAATARVSGIASSLTAGGKADGFSASVTNHTEQAVFNVTRRFLIHLDGLTPDGVRVARSYGGRAFTLLAVQSVGPGTVAATDPQLVFLAPKDRRGATVTANYELAFTTYALPGRAAIVLEAYSGDRLLARSNPRELDIRPGNGVPPTPTAQPSASALPSVTDTPTVDPLVIRPTPYGPGDVSDVQLGWPLYVFGGVLVAGGAGLLYLLLRRPRPALVEYPLDQGEDRFDGFAAGRTGYPPPYGQPPSAYRPTTVMPPVPSEAVPTNPTLEHPTIPPPAYRPGPPPHS
jgi:hypothetical protein